MKEPKNVHYFLAIHEFPQRDSRKPGVGCPPSEDYARFPFWLLHLVDMKLAKPHNAFTSYWLSHLPRPGEDGDKQRTRVF